MTATEDDLRLALDIVQHGSYWEGRSTGEALLNQAITELVGLREEVGRLRAVTEAARVVAWAHAHLGAQSPVRLDMAVARLWAALETLDGKEER